MVKDWNRSSNTKNKTRMSTLATSVYSEMKLEINNRWTFRKFTNMWKLFNTLPNNQGPKRSCKGH